MNLKIHIRQNPVFDKSTNQQIYYQGSNPQNLVKITGPLPVARQWPNYNQFIDVTNNVSDLHKLQLTWSAQWDAKGNIVSSKNQQKKSASGVLSFEKEAYELIRSWLITDVSANLNTVEVMVEDVDCGAYRGYVIKTQDINWCEGGICQYDLVIKQQDEALACIKRTMIADNWQGWFPDDGKPIGKKHPRFSYCVEQRPNGMMIALWYVMGQIMGPMAIILFGIALLINSLIFAINGIITVVNWIVNLFGGNSIPLITFLQPLQIFSSFSIYFIETAGCGREHPAPLIRDYVQNVCDKCGVIVNAQTAPLFFSNTLTINTSTGVEIAQNEYYNACYFFPEARRGIRRFNSINIFSGSPMNTDEFWIEKNEPLRTLDELLDEILPLWNHEWKVKNNELIMRRVDEMDTQGYIFDFTEGSPDRSKIVEGICFEPTDEKMPASCMGIYGADPVDANEAGGANGKGQMNGNVDFGSAETNPNYEGRLDKTLQIGATKFNLDGASTCYYYDALQQLANSGALNFTALFSIPAIADSLSTYADHALLLQGELTGLPKIVIWDGESYTNARAIKSKGAWPQASGYPIPDVNPLFNTQPQLWHQRHPPQTKVLGSGLTAGNAPDGVYEVANLVGGPMLDNPALLINYPMYFEPFYKGTLWDRFHYIDSPTQRPKLGYTWYVKIRLCCEDLRRVGVFNDAAGIVLNEKVKVPFGYYQEAEIKEITVSYDPADENGRFIELRGDL